MRNLALAHVLLADGEADEVVYALCAPSRHQAIWRRFEESRNAFPDTVNRTMRGVTAEQIGALHRDGGDAIAARYPIAEFDWLAGEPA